MDKFLRNEKNKYYQLAFGLRLPKMAEQGEFLETMVFNLLQYSAKKVRQLLAPSSALSFGKAANSQEKSHHFKFAVVIPAFSTFLLFEGGITTSPLKK